jgi:hypothetical protein
MAGRVWENSYQLPRDEEKRFIADSVETIHKVTGQNPVGWNAYWMRNSIHILETLQDLGFLYHIDEPSHELRSKYENPRDYSSFAEGVPSGLVARLPQDL